MQNIQDLAKEVLNSMTRKTRDNGESFYCLKDDAPDWMTELCRDAHGRMLPDDHKFEFVNDALHAIADFEDEDEARESLEPDYSNGSLTAWLASSNQRIGYVDDAVSNGLVNTDNFELSSALQAGQLEEKREVFESVLESLNNRVDEVDAA